MGKEKKLAILTATFNRASTLPALYESLKEQSCGDFEWVVADDGSTDGTKELVDKWMEDGGLAIRYFYKENGGKHTALNHGLKRIDSELTFPVDSDDVLTPDAVETVLGCHQKWGAKEGSADMPF